MLHVLRNCGRVSGIIVDEGLIVLVNLGVLLLIWSVTRLVGRVALAILGVGILVLVLVLVVVVGVWFNHSYFFIL